jgi:hypothetical protein
MKSNYQWLPDRHQPTGMVCRSVLRDVEQCLEWLEEESDEFRFRMALIASVALIRTVGHVLRNVDGKQHPALMEIITRRFDQWKLDRAKARVFWEFIETERNSILKEYDLRFDFAPMVTTADADHAWRIGSNLYCPVAEGAYAGEDVRDILREAVAWWKEELATIERELQTQA